MATGNEQRANPWLILRFILRLALAALVALVSVVCLRDDLK
jgi:hypothetical protein